MARPGIFISPLQVLSPANKLNIELLVMTPIAVKSDPEQTIIDLTTTQ
jgi:hypothetical protein